MAGKQYLYFAHAKRQSNLSCVSKGYANCQHLVQVLLK